MLILLHAKKNKNSLNQHVKYCSFNPNKIIHASTGQKRSIITKKRMSDSQKGKILSDAHKKKISIKACRPRKLLSDAHKKKISESMKKAHRENRAWNIGMSRWNNKKSYPEIFFESVINNEFSDLDYECEYPVGKYSIDFAWPIKKLAIEIDGSQHKRFQEIIDRDKRKDEYLLSNGWKILRIDWSNMCNNTKEKIEEAKQFILTT